MSISAVIMAGGTGTRFWPWSRSQTPKQFLPVISDRTMLEETISRLQPKIPLSRIYTVASQDQSRKIESLLPGLPQENIMVEPEGKNTAPSLLLATAKIYLQDPKTVIAALPADHLISNQDLFLKKLEASDQMAHRQDTLITFGIRPTYPATGYGYIQFSQAQPHEIDGESFFSVMNFKEKPDQDLAERFLEEGNYYWNSGIFVWQASVFAEKIEQCAPQIFPFWTRMLEALEKNDDHHLKDIFSQMPSISIDYALMEKASGVVMCEGDFGWSDVGSWSSLIEHWPRDEEGNALKGETVSLETKNCLVYNPQKITALVGVQDLIIVETEDALLVSHRNQDQKVKEVVEYLKKSGKKDLV
jgi:mannose-1-phosphate guanylyltransferase